MLKSQVYIYFAAAAFLVLLCVIGLSAYLSPHHEATDAASSAAVGHAAPSYEDTVGAEQKRWGHGHTLADPSPAATR